MADYYPLIARAVARLDGDAPRESRRAVYQRARIVLLKQLRAVNPPFSEAEITHERLALEEAVRRVEEEAAQRAGAGGVPSLRHLVMADAAAGGDGRGKAEEERREMPTMIVTGAATARLIRFWRWTSRVNRDSRTSRPLPGQSRALPSPFLA